jgi:GNAT superfamily N-acetyltransferase
MSQCLVIARVDNLPRSRFAGMLAESEASGYQFLRRVLDEWESAVNRFARPGESLLVAQIHGGWVGVCGLSIDPYLDDPRVARLRNLYVRAECRRNGVGRLLVENVISLARVNFDKLRLRSPEAGPARLYESLGFLPCQGIPNCTHILEWRG